LDLDLDLDLDSIGFDSIGLGWLTNVPCEKGKKTRFGAVGNAMHAAWNVKDYE
jgi:hypothetical protein